MTPDPVGAGVRVTVPGLSGLRAGETVLVLVGNAEALRKPFEHFGPVTVWKPMELE